MLVTVSGCSSPSTLFLVATFCLPVSVIPLNKLDDDLALLAWPFAVDAYLAPTPARLASRRRSGGTHVDSGHGQQLRPPPHTAGRLEEAEAMYQRALQGNEKALGRDHALTLDTVNNLGTLYVNQGRLEEAQATCQRALSGFQAVLGPSHPKSELILRNMLPLQHTRGTVRGVEGRR